MKVKVRNMVNEHSGRAVANQFLIETETGLYFQSYNSIIAFKPKNGGKIVLDEKYWNYSRTTGKYRNQFLRESKKETEEKIRKGIYRLENLN